MIKTIDFDKVADIYDEYVNVSIDHSFFFNETQKESGKILELMCGTGRVSIPLLEKGIELTCIDYSRGMLNKFAEKISGKPYNPELLEMDVCDFKLPGRFSLIFIPFNSFSEIISVEDQIKALHNIFNHLENNGRFICTLHNPTIRSKTIDGSLKFLGKFPLKNGNGNIAITYTNSLKQETDIVTGCQFYDFYDINDKIIEKRQMEINFSLISKAKFEQMALKAGFKIDKVYGDYSYSEFHDSGSPFMIYILRK
jgi:ubiquinone/menaquinone biosynthesis C-methylase UbiE